MLRGIFTFHEPEGTVTLPIVLDGGDTGSTANTPPATDTGVKADTIVLDGSDASKTAKEGVTAAEGAGKADKVVIEYTDFKFPEGATPDAELIAKYKETAKELGLPQESAQKIVDLGNEMLAKNQEALTKAYQAQEEENFTKLKQEWHSQLAADKEYGGQKLKETVERANWTLRHFTENMGEDGKTLRQLFATGSSNHPAMFKFLAEIAKSMGEGKLVEGGSPVALARTMESNFYPDLPSGR